MEADHSGGRSFASFKTFHAFLPLLFPHVSEFPLRIKRPQLFAWLRKYVGSKSRMELPVIDRRKSGNAVDKSSATAV